MRPIFVKRCYFLAKFCDKTRKLTEPAGTIDNAQDNLLCASTLRATKYLDRLQSVIQH